MTRSKNTETGSLLASTTLASASTSTAARHVRGDKLWRTPTRELDALLRELSCAAFPAGTPSAPLNVLLPSTNALEERMTLESDACATAAALLALGVN